MKALLMALLFIGSVAGQVMTLDDKGDDVEFTTGGVSQPDPIGHTNMDLLEGGVWSESEELLTFYLKVEDIEPESAQPLPFGDPDFYLYFQYGEKEYRVMMATVLSNPFNDVFPRGDGFSRLEEKWDENSYRAVADTEMSIDFAEELITVEVPREAITDHNQAPLAKNSTLNGFRAEVTAMGGYKFPLGPGSGAELSMPAAYDAAPDTGFGIDYIVQTGPSDRLGDLVSVSDDPVRWTNGEATTLGYTVRLTNLGEAAIDVTGSVTDAKPEWDVAFSDRFAIEAGESLDLPVLVTMPLGHNHGDIHWFEVKFESLDGDHAAATQLAVYWPSVPQPAGHHNKLWFHSFAWEVPAPFDAAFSGVHGWMSATDNEELSTSEPIPSGFGKAPGPTGGSKAEAQWFFRLEPSLRMGMDFRTEETGSFEFELNFPSPVVDPQLEVLLVHSVESGRDQEWTALATGTVETAPGAQSGLQSYDVELTIQPEADNLAYNPSANLMLVINLEATFMGGNGFMDPAELTPTFLPTDAVMELPLNEYMEPANLAFKTAALELLPGPEGQEKQVNPGRTTVYEFNLTYEGDTGRNLEIRLSGDHLEWATILGEQTFHLEAESTRQIALAILAPEDSFHGDIADITVTVVDVDNTAARTGLNTRTTVVEDVDIPDEAERSQELDGQLAAKKKSPGVGVLAILGLLAVAMRRK